MNAEMTQELLAERANYHTDTISFIERGKRSITLKLLLNIADALNTKASVIMEKAGQ